MVRGSDDVRLHAAHRGAPDLTRLGAPSSAPIRVDGKFFSAGGRRFAFRGVTYGTFLPRPDDDALFPAPHVVDDDVAAMAAAGFTVVRTYTEPTKDLVEAVAAHDMRLLAGAYYDDWRYLLGASRRQARRVVRDARRCVTETARRFDGDPAILALCIGNEIPADVVRWVGSKAVARAIAELTDAVRDVDADRLVTYANYPTAEYLPLDSLDFLTFNVYLERRQDFRRYLTRLQHLAGDRPLVLGEVGCHVVDDEQHQADFLDWQLETALERGVAGTCVFSWTDEWAVGGMPVEGWRFGLTRADRSRRPALTTVEQWNAMEVGHLRADWPSMSVVVCAYNAADTLDECLRHTCRLDYPALEIIVVDDGSTDDTAAIARRHPRARLVEIPHAGLSVARNAGLEAASGEIVAYLDADAYPAPEWPYYLALAFDGRKVGGAGGPNVPPPSDPIGAHRVARAPGGPVHVLIGDDRAEHVPGCNMAFWRDVLLEAGGFDPIYTAAGDDVDVCWKVLDAGWEIGFHPAALVWHHRRPGLRAYLRQQRGYGRSEALVEARHPDRFTTAGTARWRGRIYNPTVVGAAGRQRIYRGPYGAAAYQSVYQAGGHGLDIAHQLGVPAASLALLTTPLAPLTPVLALPAVLAVTFLVALFALDATTTKPPRDLASGRLAFRASVAMHHLLQPLVRTWGRTRSRPAARPQQGPAVLPGPVTSRGATLVLPSDRPRAELAAALVAHLRRAGLRVVPPTGWEAYDARLLGSGLVAGDLLTTAYPEGAVQVMVRRRWRTGRAGAFAAGIGVLTLLHAGAAVMVAAAAGASVVWGVYRTGPFVRRVVREAAA